MSSAAYHIIVTGQVQGVYFRASAKKMADQLGLLGTVQNLKDRSVEVYIEGPKENLDKWLDWCRIGPPNSIVKSLKINTINSKGFDDFKVIRDSS